MRIKLGYGALFAALFFSAATFAFAAESFALLLPPGSSEEARQLAAGETLVRRASSPQDLRYAAASLAAFGRPSIVEGRGIIMESAFLVSGPSFAAADKIKLFNSLAAIRSLSGVTYFSETRQKITVLFDKVYRVEAPGASKALPDTAFETLPSLLSQYVHLKDVNFGSVWYTIDIDTQGDGFEVRMLNTRPMGAMLVRVFNTEELDIRISLRPVREGVLVSSFCAASPSRTASSVADIPSAVEKRLRAVQLWVAGRIKEALR